MTEQEIIKIITSIDKQWECLDKLKLKILEKND